MRKSNWEFNNLLRSRQPRTTRSFDVLATKSSSQKTLFFLSSRHFVGKLLVPSSGVAQSVVTRLRAGRPEDRGFIPHSGRNYSSPDRVKQRWANCSPRFILKDTYKNVWNSMIIFSVLIRKCYSYILRIGDSGTVALGRKRYNLRVVGSFRSGIYCNSDTNKDWSGRISFKFCTIL